MAAGLSRRVPGAGTTVIVGFRIPRRRILDGLSICLKGAEHQLEFVFQNGRIDDALGRLHTVLAIDRLGGQVHQMKLAVQPVLDLTCHRIARFGNARLDLVTQNATDLLYLNQ
ncbi:hypothetical protein D3C87_1513670 [compost metagenome]